MIRLFLYTWSQLVRLVALIEILADQVLIGATEQNYNLPSTMITNNKCNDNRTHMLIAYVGTDSPKNRQSTSK